MNGMNSDCRDFSVRPMEAEEVDNISQAARKEPPAWKTVFQG
jgi:hypothetical protein